MMYCIKCGVELADTERRCPLCGTPVILPEGETRPLVSPVFPPQARQPQTFKPQGLLFILTCLFSLAALVCLICDYQLHGHLSWSGFAVGGILLAYLFFVFPAWFRRPNPVIMLSGDIVGICLFSLYVSIATGGGWFLSFAFPVCGAVLLIVAAAAALLYYVRRGYLYIWGGVCIATGGFMVLLEFLLRLTFDIHRGVLWSVYPLTALTLVGLMLIVIAVCRPLRESLEKKFFL